MEDRVEFLELIHHMQSTSMRMRETIDNFIQQSTTGFIQIDVELAGMVSTLFSLQNTLVAQLLEENEMIRDYLETHK